MMLALGGVIHICDSMKKILKASNESDSTLLICGKTGTGKSFLAKQAHESSKRGLERFGHINLATLSESLIESELFGHEKGAFTSADSRRVGKLEACNGGTVFLDEIGELSLRLQSKLLDFIQYKKITPVGSNREVQLDVRIIAATNKKLDEEVRKDVFREDLYHRLRVFEIHMPDLKDCPELIAPLAKTFLLRESERLGKKIHGFNDDVLAFFQQFEWPGNIRELEHVVEFSAAIESEQKIMMDSLPYYIRSSDGLARETIVSEVPVADPTAISLSFDHNYHEMKEQFERQYIERALMLCRGQINLTSRTIGLNKVSLTDKIRKLQIDWRKIREETFGPILPKHFDEECSEERYA